MLAKYFIKNYEKFGPYPKGLIKNWDSPKKLIQDAKWPEHVQSLYENGD